MVLDFHALSLADCERVSHYTWRAGHPSCDLSFANLYGWQFFYQTEVAEHGGFLFFRFQTDGHLAYMMPLGQGDRQMAVEWIKEDAYRHGVPFLLLGMSRDDAVALRTFEEGDYVLHENRDNADYLYLRTALADLAGKALQPKRNLAHRFRRLYPDYEYRPLTPEWVSLCLQLDEEWMATKGAPAEQRAVQAEAQAMRRMLAAFDELSLQGGALFVGGCLVAFTFGAPVNAETFDVCVEKADRRYEGAYAVINQELARHLPDTFVYVNREEDLGIEGLRKAKLAYHPYRLVEKLSLWSVHSLQRQVRADIRQRHEEHVKWQTRALWKCCFDDDEAFLHLYFTTKYRPDRNTFREEHGQVVAALQRLPYTLTFQGAVVPVGYISGACTHPEHRGKGWMGALLAEAHRQMRADGQVFSLLLPASASLFAYYRRFDYADCRQPASPLPAAEGQGSDTDSESVIYVYRSRPDAATEQSWQRCLDAALRRRPGTVLHDAEDFAVVMADNFQCGGGVCAMTGADGETQALLVVRQEADGVEVREGCAVSLPVLRRLENRAREAFGLPATAPVWWRRRAAQVRVLNVQRALELKAAAAPELSLTVRVVGDEVLPENNGFYRLANGICTRVPAPMCCSESLSADVIRHVSELPAWLFAGAWPRLSLMLD